MKHFKLEQLDRLRSEDTPRRLMITHTIESYWILSQKKTKSKLQIYKIRQNFKFLTFEMHYTRHTFWSCLIRCANMKWIQGVLWKIQSGHDSVHRRTDGQTDRRTDGQGDTSIPPFQLRWSGGYNQLKPLHGHHVIISHKLNQYLFTWLKPWDGVSKQNFLWYIIFPVFQNNHNTCYLSNIMFIFQRCCCSWVAMTPVKYEHISKDTTGTFEWGSD